VHEPSVSWPRVFRVLLAALFLSTGVGLWYATAHRPDFQLAFPGSRRGVVYVALLLTGGTGMVAVCGLWFWRRWAVVTYGCVAAASLALDVVAEAPFMHQLTVAVSTACVFWLIYLNRARFRICPPGGAI
jgi:hypothetical protein